MLPTITLLFSQDGICLLLFSASTGSSGGIAAINLPASLSWAEISLMKQNTSPLKAGPKQSFQFYYRLKQNEYGCPRRDGGMHHRFNVHADKARHNEAVVRLVLRVFGPPITNIDFSGRVAFFGAATACPQHLPGSRGLA